MEGETLKGSLEDKGENLNTSDLETVKGFEVRSGPVGGNARLTLWSERPGEYKRFPCSDKGLEVLPTATNKVFTGNLAPDA